ncbi:MAG: hypothetical protein NC115_07655 [Bacteroidales bacterium]|nr:hypothetical protein [Bacteroidales bacterium]
MKKILLFAALAAMMSVSCKKDNGKDNSKVETLDATITLSSDLGDLTYGEPVEVKASVESAAALESFTFTAVKKSGETYAVAGSAQTYGMTGTEIQELFFPDAKDMTALMVTVKSGNAEKSEYFPVGEVSGEARGTVWMNDAVALFADNKVATHENDPENYPVENTGAGSDTKSFFSMHGVEIDGKVEHVLSLNQLRAVDGKNGSMCFLNCLQNTKNNAFIGGQRGYMFSSLKASALGGGTTGRQCDLYEVDGHGIKDDNADIAFGMKVVNGSWKEGYDEAMYKDIDALFVKIKSASNDFEAMRAFWQLSEVQRKYDNATLGETDNPTSLTKNTFLRRWVEAGHTSTKALTENLRAGDYIIISSNKGTADEADWYYGIIQILQLPDDSSAFMTNESGKKYIDKDKAMDLFMKPVYLNVKTQCKL